MIQPHGEKKQTTYWRRTAIALLAFTIVLPSWLTATTTQAAEAPAPTATVTSTDEPAPASTTTAATKAAVTVPAAEAPITLTGQKTVTSGATLKTYEWDFARNASPVHVKANVIEVDLHNPYIKLEAIAGENGEFTNKKSVRSMADKTGAAAAVNGDFFNTKAEGVPIGPQITDGKVLATPPYMPGLYSFAITKENQPVIDLFTFEGKIVSRSGASYPLGGINKTYYWFEDDGVHQPGQHSMIDGLFLYTSAWAQIDRSNDGVTVPTEVLVRNGIIQQIAPTGIIPMIAPEDGYILRASGKADEFVREHFKVGDPLIADYRITSQNPQNQYDAASFKMMIGGQTILVDGGQPSAFSRRIADISGHAGRSRTAIGYSQDGRYVYLITADRSDDSDGLTIPELQQFMVKLGVWKGINLDGGGSTQMAVRPLGEFHTELATKSEYGSSYERPVVNGIGVYSTAPKGQVKGIHIDGPNALFIGEKATYSMKAYDEFYNPVDTSTMPVAWSSSKPVGMFQDNTFTALAPGKTSLTAANGSASTSIGIEVVGKNEIASMTIDASSTALMENSVYKMAVSITTKSGATRTVPAESVQWEFIGFEAQQDGNKLTVESIDPEAAVGRAIARYDGFSAMVTMPIYEQKIVESFNTKTPISFARTEGVTGTVFKTTDPEGNPSGGTVLGLEYDFTKGSKTTALYAVFMGGFQVDGEPESVGVKVKGDMSYNWIRAEIVDGKGKKHLVGLTENTNWSDWKMLSADLKKYNVSYPVTLTRLYVANPENGHDERGLTGTVLFDDISFLYKKPNPVTKNKVELAINKKNIRINGVDSALDQAPVLYKDNTMVPIRFVVEALGGDLTWSDSERKVTIVKDGHLLELWLDNPDMILDGQATTSEVPPILMGERTMVPLRILSEKLGWKVSWDPVAYSITLE